MARRRFVRSHDRYDRGPNINERIRATPIRLIDENNQMVGVVDTIQALRRAYEAGLDLVEVASDSTPPVCRILDYGKYKYETAKRDKATKAKSKAAELKEVRLGRSMKIDPHDIQIRLNQAKKFIVDGHKVQIVQNFRGREMMHKDRGFQRMKEIIEQLSEVARVEIPPRLAGRRLTMILAPDKPKVEAYKKKHPKKGEAEEDKQPQHEPEVDSVDVDDDVNVQEREEETVESRER